MTENDYKEAFATLARNNENIEAAAALAIVHAMQTLVDELAETREVLVSIMKKTSQMP